MATNNNWASSTVKPKYTTGGNAIQTTKNTEQQNGKKKGKAKDAKQIKNEYQKALNGSSTSKYHGWSVNGMKRFNELYDKIEKERAEQIGTAFDVDFLKFSLEQNEKKKKKQKIDTSIFESCRHELFDNMDCYANEKQAEDNQEDADEATRASCSITAAV
jgi:hypothetical protein